MLSPDRVCPSLIWPAGSSLPRRSLGSITALAPARIIFGRDSILRGPGRIILTLAGLLAQAGDEHAVAVFGPDPQLPRAGLTR